MGVMKSMKSQFRSHLREVATWDILILQSTLAPWLWQPSLLALLLLLLLVISVSLLHLFILCFNSPGRLDQGDLPSSPNARVALY